MLNVQTEHLENHTARLTVEVEPERLEVAMRAAARQIAQKARIPGFRPGKAPYQIVLNTFGRDYVVAEALESLGQVIYREALEAAEIEPYAPGSLEEVLDGGLKLVFSVPKRPTVELGDYRALRLERHVTEVTDEMVDRAMEHMRDQEALVEPVERAARMGDAVKLGHVQVTLAADRDDEDLDETQEETASADQVAETAPASEATGQDVWSADVTPEAADDFDEGDDEAEEAERVLVHEHDFDVVLREGSDDLFPGFSAQLVGLSAGDEKEFALAIPADYDDEEIAGHTLHCQARVDQVFSRTLPEWSDELAKRIGREDVETLLELRMKVRQGLEETAQNMADNFLADQALEQIIASARLSYPEEFVQDHVNEYLEDLEQRLQREYDLTLKDFMHITKTSEQELRARYRNAAVKRAERTLVISELAHLEKIEVDEDDINDFIDTMAVMVGGDNMVQFRKFLDQEANRVGIGSDILISRTKARLAAIVKGENPPIGEPPAGPESDETGTDLADEPAAEAAEAHDAAAPADAPPASAEAPNAD